MSQTKLAYITNFGLAFYLHEIFINDFKESPYFSI